MANREALRELQARLADRLQAARNQSTAVSSWLAVEAAGQRYLVPLAQSGEIFAWPGVQPVPYTQPWFLGVANLRGTLVGVADLAGLLDGEAAHSEQVLAESSLLALGAALEVNAALRVDRLLGLRGADAFAGREPAAPDAPPYFGAVHLDAQGVRWQELDLHALAQHPAFLSISA